MHQWGECKFNIVELLFRSHAKEESHRVESLDQQFVQSQDQRKGNRGDDQELGQDAHVPGKDEKADGKDYGLMEQVERKHRLIAIVQHLVVKIQVPGSDAQHKDDCAPTANAPHDLKQNVHQ